MLGGPLLILGLVVLVVWQFRGGQLTDVTARRDRPRSESARDVLNARDARGEHNDEQCDQMRCKLE